MSFLRVALRRLLALAAVLLGVSVLTFAISRALPGDPAAAALGANAREEQIRAWRERAGLDRPLPAQYWEYLKALARGDLGRSIRTRRPVARDLLERFPATLELALAATVLATIAGIAFGTWAAVRRGRLPDHVLRVVAVGGASLPVFWLGLMALGLFYYRWRIAPGGGRIAVTLPGPPRVTGLYSVDALLAGDLATFGSALAHLALPALVLACFSTALTARLTRAAVVEALGRESVRAARARGVPGGRVVLRHALRPALLPTLTVVGLSFGGLLSGAVLTETIFDWPGLGRYATASALALDFPAVMGVTLVAGTVYPLVNALVDLAQAWLDPRIRRRG